MKIDIFTHIMPKKYMEALPDFAEKRAFIEVAPALADMDLRFRIMDKHEGLMQVITLAYPPIEDIAGPKKAVELARLANDEMAELVNKYPDRFVAAVASLPLNNVDAALKEIDRAIGKLRFRGVQIFTPINDKPLDSPEFMPLYEKMAQYNLPLWIHPRRSAEYADYRTAGKSLYNIHHIFGWPYETTAAMTHLVFSGIFDRLPGLKFITHHAGAMVPFFEQRVKTWYEKAEMTLKLDYLLGLTRNPIEYYKMFYGDTAICGNTPALMCAHAFFGADHLMFGTDMPMGDTQLGFRTTRQIIEAIEQMGITEPDKKKIFEDNARRLLRLPI